MDQHVANYWIEFNKKAINGDYCSFFVHTVRSVASDVVAYQLAYTIGYGHSSTIFASMDHA